MRFWQPDLHSQSWPPFVVPSEGTHSLPLQIYSLDQQADIACDHSSQQSEFTPTLGLLDRMNTFRLARSIPL